ncbi:MAG: apolipoprotein N-acyltransferase [Planctomycetota bacterium]
MARSSTGSPSPDRRDPGLRSAPSLRLLAGVVLLGLASPPGAFPGAAFLVLPGLALVLDALRPGGPRLLALYLGGALFFAWISWSLRHLFFGSPLVMIPAAGGLYWVLLARVVRRAAGSGPALLGPAVLCCGFAAMEWLRASIPGIPYPHAQPAHALYEWPQLLRPVQVVGLVGANLLLAVTALGLVALARSHRPAVLGIGLAAWSLLALAAATPAADGRPLSLVLAQPDLPAYEDEPGYDELRRQLASETGTRDYVLDFARLGRDRAGPEPVDLWVWPESFAPYSLDDDDVGRGVGPLAWLGNGAPVLFGITSVERVPPSGGRTEPLRRRRNTAVLAAPDGRILGRAEKRLLVPIGETLPLIPLLPEAARAAVHDLVLGWSGWPMLAPGRALPLCELDGRRLGVPICFENAFPHWFRAEVDRGAAFFCALSNENWYRGGNELDQLLACTVTAALECGRPIARSTTDGQTCLVDAMGRIGSRLEAGTRGFLRVRVQPRAGRVPALLLAPLLPWLLGLVLILPFVPGRRPRRGTPAGEGDPGPGWDRGPDEAS